MLFGPILIERRYNKLARCKSNGFPGMVDVTNAQIQNVNMYWRWRQDLRQLYSSVFRWNNMPKEIDMLVVERWLMDIGHVAFFKDSELDEFIILPFTYAGKLDVYGNPVDITVYGSNGYHRILKRGEYVPIYDNLLKVTNARILETYASRMSEIDRVIDVNVSAQKTPVLIEGDSDTIDSVKTAYNQFDQNERVIVSHKGALQSTLSVYKTDAPIVFPQLQIQKKDMLDEILAFVGILNVGRYKSQHMIRSEVLAVNGLGFAERTVRNDPRDIAATNINKMFGLNISVEYSSDHGVDLMVDEKIDEVEIGGELGGDA